MTDDDGFLSRWSRRKAQVRAGVRPPEAPPARPDAPPLPAAPPAAPAADATLRPAAPPPAAPAEPPPTLADVALLTPESDFRRFLAAGVDEAVKRAALKTMLRDPHFNVMDGLDVYIDDYGKPDPIPESMLRQMVQSDALGLFEQEPAQDDGPVPDTAGAQVQASPDGAGAAQVSPSQPVPDEPDARPGPAGEPAEAAPLPDEDPDLQLQPHDPAGRRGTA